MFQTSDLVHVAIRCDFCGTQNELTVKDVVDSQVVHCSHCGGVLGALGQLREAQEQAPKAQARR